MTELKQRVRVFLCLVAIVGIATFQFLGIGVDIVSANTTPQTLPFSQNWTNTGLITTNDDWNNVPGIVGYLGNYTAASPTNVDPRTLLSPFDTNDVDVIANQTTPDTLTSGGVAEFEITNPTVALQGSGTADAPHIILYLNTTGQSNIRVSYNARDIDGSGDDAVQQIVTQYRVGNSGDFINVPGGYIADATTGPNLATLVTAVNVTLPAAANNQPQVQVRIMTTNAGGSDEWVGIDDISVTTAAAPAPSTANVDFNGDGRSDWVVTRAVNNNLFWWINYNGTNNTAVPQWGLSTDVLVPQDYDGDGRDDIAVWRPGLATQAAFYILHTGNFTVRIVPFGQTGDDPRIVMDYDGDGRADPSVYRRGAAGAQNFFFYLGSSNNPNNNITFVPWGSGPLVRPYPGDFDGDNRGDFVVFSPAGVFSLLRSSNFTVEYVYFGTGADALVPGDFDGDGRSDFALVRVIGNLYAWYILERDGGGTGGSPIFWGVNGDGIAPGDYDGDGSTDITIWRPSADPSQNYFWVRRSSDPTVPIVEWGMQGDFPAAAWHVQPVLAAKPQN